MRGRALKIETTNHPHIVTNREICNGSPVVDGTRMRVIDIAVEYEMLGHSPDEIISSHPQLTLHQVHDALSFYYENRDELDRKFEQDQEIITRIKQNYPLKSS